MVSAAAPPTHVVSTDILFYNIYFTNMLKFIVNLISHGIILIQSAREVPARADLEHTYHPPTELLVKSVGKIWLIQMTPILYNMGDLIANFKCAIISNILGRMNVQFTIRIMLFQNVSSGILSFKFKT